MSGTAGGRSTLHADDLAVRDHHRLGAGPTVTDVRVLRLDEDDLRLTIVPSLGGGGGRSGVAQEEEDLRIGMALVADPAGDGEGAGPGELGQHRGIQRVVAAVVRDLDEVVGSVGPDGPAQEVHVRGETRHLGVGELHVAGEEQLAARTSKRSTRLWLFTAAPRPARSAASEKEREVSEQ